MGVVKFHTQSFNLNRVLEPPNSLNFGLDVSFSCQLLLKPAKAPFYLLHQLGQVVEAVLNSSSILELV